MSRGILIAIIVVIVAITIGIGFMFYQSMQPKLPSIKGKRVLVVIFEGYQPLEFNPVCNTLRKADAKVDILAINKTVGVQYTYYILDVKNKLEGIANEYDAIVLIGGPGVYERVTGRVSDPGMPILMELCKIFYQKGKLVAAICAAPGILAKAGLLKGREATCFSNTELINILKANGAKYVSGKAVVVSGNIITSVGPSTAQDFANALVNYLAKK